MITEAVSNNFQIPEIWTISTGHERNNSFLLAPTFRISDEKYI